jgi:hypothetical protein
MADDYKVTNTQRVSIFGEAGVPQQGYRVYFQVAATNWVDFVEVPEADFDEAKIATLIEAKVAAHLAIAEL